MISNVLNLKSLVLQRLVKLISGQEYLTIQIDITNTCNLKCSHCYHANHINKDAISLDDWFEILEQYKNLTNKLLLKPSFIICGGEPLLSTKFKPLVQKIKTMWPSVPISVLTNGTLLNEKNITFLQKHDIEIQVSLDGPSSREHDLKRGEGNFDKSISGIKVALDKDMRVHILAILSKNSSEWVGDFFKMASELRVYSMNFTRFIPMGNGRKMVSDEQDQPLAGIELRDAYISILKNSKIFGVSTNTNKPLFCLIDKSLGSHSKFGFQGLIIDFKGNLKVSSRTDFILGNALKEGLENLFLKHPLLKRLRKSNIQGCGKCEFLTQCGGDRNISYAANGDFLGFDHGCWKSEILNMKGVCYEN